MSVVINTNYSALVASNNLATSSSMLQKSLNRLSSGSRIVSPADDAGGLAVSMKISAAANRQGAVANNIGNSVSYLQTQDGALSIAGKVLDRMSQLSILYSDPTKNTSDQANYDSEFKSLQSQLSALTSEKFNGTSLFGTTGLSVGVTEDGATTVSLAGIDLTSTSSGVGQVSGTTNTSLGTVSLSTITSALQNVATFRANNGANQSRLGFAGDLINVNKTNLEAANSRIIDVDVASESTQLARWNVLVQAGTAMLAQANQSPQSALKLLG